MTGFSDYKFADVVWRIPSCHEFTQNMLAPFKTQDKPQQILGIHNCEPIEQNERLLRQINRVLCDRYDGLMLHSAALVYAGRAYLFTAPPGTGKTTHLRLWQKYMPEQSYILCGDKPFIRIFENEIRVYGGPWQGKERLGISASAPLGGIYLLKRGEQNRVCPAERSQKLSGLLSACFFENEMLLRQKTVGILERICKSTDISVLYCNTEQDAVQTVKEHIDKRQVLL